MVDIGQTSGRGLPALTLMLLLSTWCASRALVRLMDVRTSAYQPALDVLAGCRGGGTKSPMQSR
jgi:hypothetical protein